MMGKRWYLEPLRRRKTMRERECVVRMMEAPTRREPKTSSKPIVVAISDALMVDDVSALVGVSSWTKEQKKQRNKEKNEKKKRNTGARYVMCLVVLDRWSG